MLPEFGFVVASRAGHRMVSSCSVASRTCVTELFGSVGFKQQKESNKTSNTKYERLV